MGRSRRFAEKMDTSQDHAAVPRTLRGATNGASGGDSPMSEPSRTAGGGFGTHLRLGGLGPGGYSGQVAVRLSRPAPRWRISSAPRRSCPRAHSSCARQRSGSPSASLRPPRRPRGQPSRAVHRGQCQGERGAGAVCSAAVSSGSCECRTTLCGQADAPTGDGFCNDAARRASSTCRAAAACASRRCAMDRRRERRHEPHPARQGQRDRLRGPLQAARASDRSPSGRHPRGGAPRAPDEVRPRARHLGVRPGGAGLRRGDGPGAKLRRLRRLDRERRLRRGAHQPPAARDVQPQRPRGAHQHGSGRGRALTRAVPRWGRGVVAPTVLTALAAAAWANSLSAPFIFDDRPAILANPHIRQLWPLSRALTAPPRSILAGRPVASLTLAINDALGELDVRGYHAFNLALHVLSALILLGIVRRTLARSARLVSAARPLALVTAAIWLVHPLQTDAVTYFTQRTELLMGLFYLLTLYAAIRAGEGSWPWQTASVVSCALGMASKEVMITAPLMVMLWIDVPAAGRVR